MSIVTPIFALEFVSPGMLGWLAAAAAPLVIHLWSRRRYREMPWAAVEYLLAALRQAKRRIQLEQLLLLLVRTLIVVLVVFAVAEPALQGIGFGAATGQPTYRLLVIDGSYSMAYKPADKSRFDRARQIASEIVDESDEGDGFGLILMSDPPRVVVGTPAFDPRDFVKEVEQLEMPHAGADLVRTLAAVEQVLATARREAPRLARHEVYFLTDLHKVSWGLEGLNPGALADFHKQSRRLGDSAALVVVDLGQRDAENVAVTAVECLEPVATVGQPVELKVKVKNFGRQVRPRQPVELAVDERRVQQELIDLPAGGEATVPFSCRFEVPGDHVLEVRAPGDRLEVDNRRYFVLPVKQAIQVLCIDGRPSGAPLRGATGYLASALSPREDDRSRAAIRPEVAPESAILEYNLSRYDCTFLADVARFTASEAKVLEAYVKGGGSLVFFLGEQVQAANYNRELGGESPGGTRLLPARLGAIVTQSQDRLDPLGYLHPMVRAFSGRERAGLLTTPVHKHFQLTVPKDSKAKVALALAGGDPLIVEEPIHRGRVVLVATAADVSGDAAGTPWTYMPLWPSFVPLVHEMLACAVGGQVQQRNLLVGDVLGGSFAMPLGEMPFSMRRLGGRSDQVRFHAQGDQSTWSYPDTGLSDVYAAEFGPPVSRTDRFAVNVDSKESDLGVITPEHLHEHVWPGVAVVHQTTGQSLDRPAAAGASRRSDLSKALLYAALLLLFAETYMARRFGYHAS